MAKTFRIAIGNCSAKNPGSHVSGVARKTCAIVIRRIEHLKSLSFEQLHSLPEEVEEIEWCDGHSVEISTVRQRLEGEKHLIIVQAFRRTLHWPTWISLHGVGQMVAEGFLISTDGIKENASNDLLLTYR